MSNYFFLLCGFCLATLALAQAGPPSIFNFDELEKSSECVCVVRVLAVKQLENNAIVSANCAVLTCLKGHCGDHIDIAFKTYGVLSADSIFIVFLKSSKDQSYVFAVEDVSAIPLAGYSKDNDLPDASMKERIESQLKSDLGSTSPNEVVRALGWLDELQSPLAKSTSERLRGSDDAGIAFAAMTLLARLKDKKAIETLAEIATDRITKFKTLTKQDREAAAWTLESVKDDVPVQLANGLSLTDNEVVVHAGIEILRKVGDASSVPFLIKNLRAKNIDIAYGAFSALTKIIGTKSRKVSYKDFVLNPVIAKEVIGDWEKWWSTAKSNYPKIP